MKKQWYAVINGNTVRTGKATSNQVRQYLHKHPQAIAHGPFTTKQAALAKVLSPMRNNPPSPGTEIYDRILEIRAQKGSGSLWPGEFFKHEFKSQAKIYGLDNGDILIRSTTGKRLWKKFDY